jgi:hypothetical protein
MRDIEGIENVVALLKPHWPQIDSHFNEENKKFIALISRPHDGIGRLLKCHLILEHYLDRYLSEHFEIEEFENAKLSFFNKASLLPGRASSAAFVKPGILRLNVLRNRAGHRLGADFSMEDLGPINAVLSTAREGIQFKEPVEAIEAFTTIACTWLIVPPRHLQEIFTKAFSEVRVNEL